MTTLSSSGKQSIIETQRLNLPSHHQTYERSSETMCRPHCKSSLFMLTLTQDEMCQPENVYYLPEMTHSVIFLFISLFRQSSVGICNKRIAIPFTAGCVLGRGPS